jgi:acetyl esterase/lipase
MQYMFSGITKIFYLVCFVIVLTALTNAQDKILKIWQNEIPGSIENKNYIEEKIKRADDIERTSKVSVPTISVFLPAKEKATGTAVVICPGGGYSIIASEHEGRDIAAWLNNLGIAGIIVKYRLPSDEIMKNKTIGPLQDVQEAFRLVRRNTKEWGINTDKIGVIGFSAGGHLASTISTHYNYKVYESDTISCRPDFSILIYPVISMSTELTHMGSRENLLGKNPDQKLINFFSNDLQVDENTPPAFIVHSADDKAVPVQNSINYLLALKKFNIPAELHIYEKGGHGYGLGRNLGTESNWPEDCKNWLKARGYIGK